MIKVILFYISCVSLISPLHGTNPNPNPIVIVQRPPPPKIICSAPNEVFTQCVSPCQPTCDHPHTPCHTARTNVEALIIVDNPSAPRPPRPSNNCVPGCVCAHGYVRNNYGRCVLPQDCHPHCPRHSHYAVCGPKCQPTCDDFSQRSLQKCAYGPCTSGCFCNLGYVKDPRTGHCVHPEHCTRDCPHNEHWATWSYECRPTCDNPFPEYSHCKNTTIHGCYCKAGFVRDLITKKCCRPQECPPKKCGINEQFYECAPCEGTCTKPKPGVCPLICRRGCGCKPGYVRLTHGKCIRACDCPHIEHH